MDDGDDELASEAPPPAVPDTSAEARDYVDNPLVSGDAQPRPESEEPAAPPSASTGCAAEAPGLDGPAPVASEAAVASSEREGQPAAEAQRGASERLSGSNSQDAQEEQQEASAQPSGASSDAQEASEESQHCVQSSTRRTWAQYRLPASQGGGFWWSCADEWFVEQTPVGWEKFRDPSLGKFYWYNGATEEWFYA